MADDLRETGPPPNRTRVATPVEKALEGIARRLRAVAIAYYETGRTMQTQVKGRPSVNDPNWTGQVYLVAAWADVPAKAREGDLEGFPASIAAKGHDDLVAVIAKQGETRLVTAPDHLPHAFSCRAIEACHAEAAILVSASFNREYPALAILYFHTTTLAAQQLELLRQSREGDYTEEAGERRYSTETGVQQEIQEALDALGTSLMHQATNQHLSFLSDFQTRYLTAMRDFPVSRLSGPFNDLMDDAIHRLSRDIQCPDVRVYLIEAPTPTHLGEEEEQGEEPHSNRRFALKWRSWPDAPTAAVPLDDDGPIGWCLRNRQSIYIHNRTVLEGFPDKRRATYPGLENLESQGIDYDGRKVNLMVPDVLPFNRLGPPTALLLHPIVIAGRSIGVLVCNGRSSAPYVFHNWDDTSLGVIAVAIGSTWVNLEHRRQADQDRAMLARAESEISAFSRKIAEWIGSGRAVEAEVYQEALHTADRVVGVTGHFSSIRLIDGESMIAKYKYRSGDIWERHDHVRKFEQSEFDVRESPPTTAAAEVFQKRKPFLVRVADRLNNFRNTFGDQMAYGLYVPIFDPAKDREVIGILDIRTSQDQPFPRSTRAILIILTEMIGLARTLIDSQQQLRASNAQLALEERRQIDMFEDLAHQVMTPLRGVHERLGQMERLMGSPVGPSATAMQEHVAEAQALLRRGMRVSMAARFFRELRETGRISQIDRNTPIPVERLQERIQTLIHDQERLLRSDQKLKILYDRGSFRRFYDKDIVGDMILLEQVIANLLENAVKYSMADTVIEVFSTISSDRTKFVVEVNNFGLPIPPTERQYLTMRGYRSADAKLLVPEGQGIGLWLADQIMKSFCGTMEIVPALTRSVPHRFRLLFPRRRRVT